MKDIQILGVDLGKNSCSVVGLDAAGRALRRRTRRSIRMGSAGGDHPTSPAVEGLRVVEARWPDSQPVSHQPRAENGTRCRPLYETWDARISILARFKPETGYVDADCSNQIAETACRRGGPYVSARGRAVRLHGGAIDKHLGRRAAGARQSMEEIDPDAFGSPADIAIVECRAGPVGGRRIDSAPAGLENMDDAADDRRSSTSGLPRVSVGRCGSISLNCVSASQNRSRSIHASSRKP